MKAPLPVWMITQRRRGDDVAVSMKPASDESDAMSWVASQFQDDRSHPFTYVVRRDGRVVSDIKQLSDIPKIKGRYDDWD